MAFSQTERIDKFWIKTDLRLSSFERSWLRNEMELPKDYSMGSEMDTEVEQNVENRLILVGPMLDGYLKEIGIAMLSKLTRSHLTGLIFLIKLYVPWQIMRFMAAIVESYRGSIQLLSPKKNKKKFIFSIEKQDTAVQLFNPSRFNGINLQKCKYFKIKDHGIAKTKLSYVGESNVVVSINTPIRMKYFHNLNNLKVSFYIQRYTAESFVVDAAVQSVVNKEFNNKLSKAHQ